VGEKGKDTSDSLRSLGNSMFGQFTREDQPNGCLDFAGGDGRFFVVGGEFGGFSGDTFKDIVDEGV